MEEEPKSQMDKEKSPEKPTRRKFLKVIGGGLSASLLSGDARKTRGNIEKIASLTKETAMGEQEWLREVKVVPDSRRQLVIEAYKSLPPQLQLVLRSRGVEVTFKEGDILGAATASDQFGMDIDIHNAYVRWPAEVESVSFPWGKIRLVDATRHELSHIALERVFINNSKMWIELVEALREEGEEFIQKVASSHEDAAYLDSPSSIAHYQALHEYLASLIEHCGKPIRVPLPSGRARPMVEALVQGGACN